jgi:hypothetical protein
MVFMNDREIGERIDQGIHEGVAKALMEHKKAGRAIAVWENGRVIWIPPEMIRVEEEIEKELP